MHSSVQPATTKKQMNEHVLL